MIIAIDGPAASGKSTTARLLADKLDFIHLNSGLMYRAVTYIFIKNGFLNKEISLNRFFTDIDLEFNGKNLDSVFYNGKDITSFLNDEKINENIKIVSNNKLIRKKLIELQREIVKDENVVCEGRDIGSVVFPNAEFKFYLNANIEKRAERRFNEISKSDSEISKKSILENLKKRDSNDINRKNSPLIKVSDCIEIDTTELTINQQVEYIYSIIKK